MITRRDLLIRVPLVSAIAVGMGNAPSLADLVGGVCTLTCSQTLGPCYYAQTLVRRDITEGETGLPALLSFLVLDADTCQPIENAAIDIWHTSRTGIYSAPITAMCNSGDSAARTKTFMRGIQMTDANGWAHFDSVFPGWYSGRTTHIHATIRIGSTDIVTTQFYFDDALTDSIYRNHPSYISRPNRDTTNRTDNILGGSLTRMAPFVFNTKLISQQSLVALKVITIRRSATRCNA